MMRQTLMLNMIALTFWSSVVAATTLPPEVNLTKIERTMVELRESPRLGCAFALWVAMSPLALEVEERLAARGQRAWDVSRQLGENAATNASSLRSALFSAWRTLDEGVHKAHLLNFHPRAVRLRLRPHFGLLKSLRGVGDAVIDRVDSPERMRTAVRALAFLHGELISAAVIEGEAALQERRQRWRVDAVDFVESREHLAEILVELGELYQRPPPELVLEMLADKYMRRFMATEIQALRRWRLVEVDPATDADTRSRVHTLITRRLENAWSLSMVSWIDASKLMRYPFAMRWHVGRVRLGMPTWAAEHGVRRWDALAHEEVLAEFAEIGPLRYIFEVATIPLPPLLSLPKAPPRPRASAIAIPKPSRWGFIAKRRAREAAQFNASRAENDQWALESWYRRMANHQELAKAYDARERLNLRFNEIRANARYTVLIYLAHLHPEYFADQDEAARLRSIAAGQVRLYSYLEDSNETLVVRGARYFSQDGPALRAWLRYAFIMHPGVILNLRHASSTWARHSLELEVSHPSHAPGRRLPGDPAPKLLEPPYFETAE